MLQPHNFSTYASYLLMFLGLTLVLTHGLAAGFLAGLLVYSLVTIFSPSLNGYFGNRRARLIVVGVIGILIVSGLVMLAWSGVAFFRSESGSAQALLQKMVDIIEASRTQCPQWICSYLPDTSIELRAVLSDWMREHANEAKLIGADAGHTFVRVLLGMIIGAMVSLNTQPEGLGPFGQALLQRVSTLANAFKKVVFAQVKISAVNACFTGIYILVLLPAFDVHLPFAKTLILITFLLGLLPIIGNILSNTVIVTLSLPFGVMVAAGSLLFLIVLHKLEYFLNAKIIGHQIQSKAWELLLAMLVMESLFGLPGVAMAPILYAYVKRELVKAGMV